MSEVITSQFNQAPAPRKTFSTFKKLLIGGMALVVVAIAVFIVVQLYTASNDPKPKKAPPLEWKEYKWSVVDAHPHDSYCFTQGLEFANDTHLIETCGLIGESRVQYYEKGDCPGQSSPCWKGPSLLLEHPEQQFAEGVTFTSRNEMLLLTWRDQVFHAVDISNQPARIKRTVDYPFEGWGAGFDRLSQILYLSNGTANIMTFRITPDSDLYGMGFFKPLCNGREIQMINELEVVSLAQLLYFNVWFENKIYVVDLKSRHCIGFLDLSDLAAQNPLGVLNGIAYYPNDDTLWVTGKNWETMYQLKVKKW